MVVVEAIVGMGVGVWVKNICILKIPIWKTVEIVKSQLYRNLYWKDTRAPSLRVFQIGVK